MNSKKLTIGLIGFGYWGQKFIVPLKKNPYVSQIIVADTNQYQKNYISDPTLNFTTDIDALLTETDAIIIATPENTHYQLARLGLLNGNHVLIEKPFATTAVDAKRLITLSQGRQLTLMVDHTFLYDSTYALLKNYLAENKIGTITQIESIRHTIKPNRLNSNVILDLLPHDLSIFYDLTPGPIDDLSITHINTTASTAKIHLQFPTFTTKSLLSWVDKLPTRRLTITGTKGNIIWSKSSSQEDKLAIQTTNQTENFIVGNKHGTLEYVVNHFVSCLINKNQPLTGGCTLIPQVLTLEKIVNQS